jgi:hypothetical protein
MSGNSDTSRDGDEGGYLAKMLRGAQIEWPPNENSYFIPINKIRALENQELVWEELQGLFPTMSGDRLENYVKVICTKATKIFAVILFSPPRKSEAILTFIDEGITDANLPLVRVYRRRGSPTYTLAKKEHDECHEQGHRGCGIKALSKWGRTGIQNLCRDQWLAQAPVFKKCEQEILHYEFDGAVILPFTDDEENAEGGLKIGGYSEVWGVKIHPAHQDILISADTSVWPDM